ncbi:dolichyl-phosphate-mannose--protein mannosyltransferase [Actinoplanes regularis]|uniref:dolichyl-phosphate-mannose--protein mannosyltransferase n=1 Tax=Actinoplanes regularis TaxID=52697 RepID=UPI0025568690|nr:glycosyltransferase family 39 protein [Actinoplanes regularis]
MTTAVIEPAVRHDVPDIVRRRLATLEDWLDPYSWLVTGIIGVVAAILRLTGVNHPKGYVFDEIYYPTDAWDMLQHGVEWDEKTDTAGYVVHPPLGKWLIALGEKMFGNTELGWRFPTAIAGTLMIVILIRVAYRMFHSVVLAATAGLLMTLDGFQLVLSRTSLLDIFLGLFVLATFAAVLLDRDHYRRRLLRALETGYDPEAEVRAPRIVPWWLLAAGALFGLACGVKWSALFFLPFFAALIVVWRVQARRSAGLPSPLARGLAGDLGWSLFSVVLSGLFYLATWTGWLITDTGWDRHYRALHGMSEPPVLGALLNLLHYHQGAYGFHSTLTKTHTYQSWPWQWLVLGRPVAFYWPDNPGDCGAGNCIREILLLGTPLLWWSFLPALVTLLWLGISRRDWRAYAIVGGAAAGLLPWFYFAAADNRTMFSFYTLPALPFLILAVVYVLGALIASPRYRAIGAVTAGLYVGLVALCFAYFYPIFVGDLIPYDAWMSRMWLGNRWI